MNKHDLDPFLRNEWEKKANDAKYAGLMPYISRSFASLNDRSAEEKFKVAMHGKYVAVPAHRHTFFEMMYVYSGSLTHIIDGKEVQLSTGDFCIFDLTTAHSVKKSTEKDEAVNFVMNKDFFTPDFLSRLLANNLFSSFFTEALYKTDNDKNYLVIHTGNSEIVRDYATGIMREYFDPDPHSPEIIENLLLLLLYELMRIYRQTGPESNNYTGRKQNIWPIIRYIETNYLTVTLKSVAARFGYSPKYLSNMLVTNVGQTFTQLKHEACLNQASFLLQNTKLTTTEVANAVGFSNYTFFYSLFKKRFGTTPAEHR